MSDQPFAPDCGESLRRHLRPELFRALSDPTRLQVLGRLALALRPLTVTEISGCCGVHLSGVSRHLAILREAGAVEAVKEGREVRYSLKREDLTAALRGLADSIDRCGETRASLATNNDVCCPATEGSVTERTDE
jgi:DNA-binding transcriptional ArsR family regulator